MVTAGQQMQIIAIDPVDQTMLLIDAA